VHAYYVATPESPDGCHVLFFASEQSDAGFGDIVVRDRLSGEERALSTGVVVEDAHRVACQHWCDGGRCVAYQNFQDGKWLAMAVDLASGTQKVLAENCQVGFAHPLSPWVPVIGFHARPDGNTGIRLVHARTGDVKESVSAADVSARYGDWISKTFGGHDISLYFPVVGPGAKRMFFKVARALGDGVNSIREGLITADLESGNLLSLRPTWGHPVWHPDGHRIIESKSRIVFSDTGEEIALLPAPSQHPSPHPDGHHYVTDTYLLREDGTATGEWAVIVNRLAGDEPQWLHRFDNTGGAKSHRVPHPHPAVSADGRRIYFNVSSGAWTRLHVSEWPIMNHTTSGKKLNL
jgi:hypothetical protein